MSGVAAEERAVHGRSPVKEERLVVRPSLPAEDCRRIRVFRRELREGGTDVVLTKHTVGIERYRVLFPPLFSLEVVGARRRLQTWLPPFPPDSSRGKQEASSSARQCPQSTVYSTVYTVYEHASHVPRTSLSEGHPCSVASHKTLWPNSRRLSSGTPKPSPPLAAGTAVECSQTIPQRCHTHTGRPSISSHAKNKPGRTWSRKLLRLWSHLFILYLTCVCSTQRCPVCPHPMLSEEES
jgi:hypothetical protein